MTEMNCNRNSRWRLLADLRIQGPLLLRLVFYWMLFQIAQVGTIALFSYLSEGSGSGFDLKLLIPSVVVSALVLPFAMLDMLKFSNRFIGPMLNLRKKLRTLAIGGAADPVRFRPGDFYIEMSEDFNQIQFRSKPQQTETRESFAAENSDTSSAGTECHV